MYYVRIVITLPDKTPLVEPDVEFHKLFIN